MSEGVTLEVRIEPVDPILFGDNRSARIGESHAVSDQDPSPATLYGAIGGRIASQLGARGERHWAPAEPVLGPFIPDLRRQPGAAETAELLGYALCDTEGRPWFPKPLHLRVRRAKSGAGYFALDLLRPPREKAAVLSSLPAGWQPLQASEMDMEEAEEPLWLDQDLLADFLSGSLLPGNLTGSARTEDAFYFSEKRLGLAMSNSANVAESGRLFARPYRRFARGLDLRKAWASRGYLAWYRVRALPADGAGESAFDGLGFLGGDRRRADLRFVRPDSPNPLSEMRKRIIARAKGSEGYLAYLLTPLPRPAEEVTLEGRRPVAGAVGRPQRVSGWSSATAEQGPRPLLTLLPAGSVFFFKWEGQDPEAWIEKHWLTSLDPEHAAGGFGRILLGVWGERA